MDFTLSSALRRTHHMEVLENAWPRVPKTMFRRQTAAIHVTLERESEGTKTEDVQSPVM